jgi:conjugal transfer pilus assembly protein TraB
MLQERLAAIEGNKVAPVANLPPPSQTALSEPGVGKDGELLLGSDGMPLRAPEAGKGNQAGTLNQGQSSTPIPTTIQVVREEKKPVSQTEKKLVPTPVGYITSGANFEAVLLNGMDASTAIGANKTPTPALLRIKSDAILPNMFTFDVKECFVMVGGFGNMSTERVEMRTETMSCIDQKGQVWEGKVEGYLVGEDGKAGARGRVVSKQGALLAKSFMAGFIGGLGTAFSPQQNQALTLLQNGETQQSYQYPSGSEVLGSGISKGLSQSGNALSAFYIKLAEQMFPVVELDAGRKMTIILLKGVELKMDKRV